jgi:exopolyphosphatase/guanosine-5'-triphosphate,3'-diphosphate pyrophosphatase
MPPRTFATADIGSNTVHLLVAQTDGRGVVRLENQSFWLGLGEEVAANGEIGKEKQRELAAALTSFKKIAASRKAQAMYVFATEAVRRAANHKQVLTSIRQRAGIEVDVISSEREAELAVKGAMLDSFGEMPTAFFDIGGGSAQVARVEASGVTRLYSLPLGTGTISVKMGLEDPASPEAYQRFASTLDKHLDPLEALLPIRRMVGGGGVARGIMRSLHADKSRLIERYEIDYLEETARKTSSRVLSKRFGVSGARAKTLFPGVSVVRKLMDVLDCPHILISEFGIREGAVLELAEGKLSLQQHEA